MRYSEFNLNFTKIYRQISLAFAAQRFPKNQRLLIWNDTDQEAAGPLIRSTMSYLNIVECIAVCKGTGRYGTFVQDVFQQNLYHRYDIFWKYTIFKCLVGDDRSATLELNRCNIAWYQWLCIIPPSNASQTTYLYSTINSRCHIIKLVTVNPLRITTEGVICCSQCKITTVSTLLEPHS